MSLTDTVLRYLQAQTEENFMAVRAEIASVPGFSPYANFEAEALVLVEQREFEEALAGLKAMMPGGFFSPGLHDLLAHIHDLMNNAEEARNETYLALAVLNGILATGDGSEARPYLVLQISDEYDVLKALGKVSGAQSLLQRQGKVLDRHACHDGNVLWFDITLPWAETQPNA